MLVTRSASGLSPLASSLRAEWFLTALTLQKLRLPVACGTPLNANLLKCGRESLHQYPPRFHAGLAGYERATAS